MKKKWYRSLFLILVLLAAGIAINLWSAKTLKFGLDIVGGSHLLLEADMSAINPGDRESALNSLKTVVAKRVDLYGVAEPVIQTAITPDSYRLIVELPGVTDINQAIELIGKTAQLDFRENVATDSATSGQMIFVSTGLTGSDLTKAAVTFNQQQAGSQPTVSLEFTNEGAQKFAAITQRNVGKPLAIFLDDQLVTAPIVNEPILDGRAVISGQFTTDNASQLVIQLNAGALPVPTKIIEQTNISASLGSAAVNASVRAGIVGLGLVMGFMILVYRLNGLLADIALLIYGLLTLAVYRLIPVTLTLPGVAGFILSMGMAVDANILIFERLKEELKAGKPFGVAMHLGFGRAWDAIKDANITTIVVSLILLNPFNFNWLNSSGLVRGFALTLLIGVILSLVTGIVITRNLMRLTYFKKINQ
ncbi:MAG TPA: protein translocase subunit SecD [Patescibacteria group bacterium]|nr:protein translocase subunit SecD [Patescibacteria group bacterium]